MRDEHLGHVRQQIGHPVTGADAGGAQGRAPAPARAARARGRSTGPAPCTTATLSGCTSAERSRNDSGVNSVIQVSMPAESAVPGSRATPLRSGLCTAARPCWARNDFAKERAVTDLTDARVLEGAPLALPGGDDLALSRGTDSSASATCPTSRAGDPGPGAAFVDTQVAPVANDYWERAEFPCRWWPLRGAGRRGRVAERVRLPGHERRRRRPGRRRTRPRRRQLHHLQLRAHRTGHGRDRAARRRGAEAALATRDGRCTKLGAFALTEPDHGSDVVALATRARRDGGGWVLDGANAGSATAPSPTSWSSGPATTTARSARSSSTTPRPETRSPATRRR